MDAVVKEISDKKSPLYNSTNWREIKQYLWLRGIDVDEQIIKKTLENQKINLIKYKNSGLQKIRQTGLPFVMRQRFFSTLQADSLVLSKNRKYGIRTPNYILVVICQLSRFVILEPTVSMKFSYQKLAWDNVFKKIKTVVINALWAKKETNFG